MSEKQQRTAASMRSKMNAYYGDQLYHKHNKDHLAFHPQRKGVLIESSSNVSSETVEGHPHWPTKAFQEAKKRKTRKRLDKGRYH